MSTEDGARHMTGYTARSNPRLFVTHARGDRDLVDRLAAGL
jgi:hypothetical protein